MPKLGRMVRKNAAVRTMVGRAVRNCAGLIYCASPGELREPSSKVLKKKKKTITPSKKRTRMLAPILFRVLERRNVLYQMRSLRHNSFQTEGQRPNLPGSDCSRDVDRLISIPRRSRRIQLHRSARGRYLCLLYTSP